MMQPDESIVNELGQVHVYTGDAKGKTTAALGLALRAVGRGLKIYIGQFMKKRHCGEHEAIEKYLADHVKVEQFGTGIFAFGEPRQEDYDVARDGFEKTRFALHSGKYNMVIMDEINVAVSAGVVNVEDVLQLVNEKPKNVELVLTGRSGHPKIIEAADLVTEMKIIKHYYDSGVSSRKGIEE